MSSGGNSKWSGNYVPEERLIPLSEKPRKKKSNEREQDLAQLFSEPKRERRPKTEKEKKWAELQKRRAQSPEALAEKAERARIRAMTPEVRADYFAKDKFINRKANLYYKKHGQMPPASMDKKWLKDYQKHKKRRQLRERDDIERVWGKMTDKQYKAHLIKQRQWKEKQEAERKKWR